jgi:NAD(P)H-hydrate epimerase
MKILSAAQIQAVDRCTMEREPITSWALMERAAGRMADRLTALLDTERPIVVVAGTGNNGGDGLVLARRLLQAGFSVTSYFFPLGRPSADNEANQNRLMEAAGEEGLQWLDPERPEIPLPNNAVLVDALFGSGLNRPLEGPVAELVQRLNEAACLRIAVDIPSGLYADSLPPEGSVVFHAHRTITFQIPKASFFWAEAGAFVGRWEVLDIGLHPACIAEQSSAQYYLDRETVRFLRKTRGIFDHKGSFGHGLIIGGSPGKIGAALMATEACMRSGSGLTSAFLPAEAHPTLHTLMPEAMVVGAQADGPLRHAPENLEAYAAVGLGPGLDQTDASAQVLSQVLERYRRPMVIDADGLNLLAQYPEWLQRLPTGSILTPHPGEWARLSGGVKKPTPQALEDLCAFARRYQLVVLRKGAYTAVADPEGRLYFNSTGNPGMATGGTGDVLCGMLTGLLAQGYPPTVAAQLGVWLHGSAGDLALENGQSPESLLARDLLQAIGQAFSQLESDAL